jgi:hypothetical protein
MAAMALQNKKTVYSLLLWCATIKTPGACVGGYTYWDPEKLILPKREAQDLIAGPRLFLAKGVQESLLVQRGRDIFLTKPVRVLVDFL